MSFLPLDDPSADSGPGGGAGFRPPPPPPISAPAQASSPLVQTSGDRLKALIRKRYLGAPPSAAPGTAASVMGTLPFQAAPAAAAPAAVAAPAAASGGIGHFTPPIGQPAPAGGNPFTPGSERVPGVNFGGGFFGALNEILRGGYGSGAFSSQPNQAILDMVRSLALSDAEAARSRTALQSQSLGADPATAASYALQSDLESQHGVAEALSRAILGELTQGRDFTRTLLLSLLGKQGPQNVYDPTKSTEVLDTVTPLIKPR